MNTKIIYIIAGIFVIASLGYALDSWNEFGTDGVQNGDILTAGMLNTLFHNVKNLTDIMHSEGDVLNVSGRIKAADPIDNDDIVNKGWVLANAAGGGATAQAQVLLPSDQNPAALHSAQDCTSAGGIFELVDGKYYCIFEGEGEYNCPSGWTFHKFYIPTGTKLLTARDHNLCFYGSSSRYSSVYKITALILDNVYSSSTTCSSSGWTTSSHVSTQGYRLYLYTSCPPQTCYEGQGPNADRIVYNGDSAYSAFQGSPWGAPDYNVYKECNGCATKVACY